jgi:hypothetical protein
MAMGQTVTGSITGEVTDPNGALVPGVHVVAHNLDMGVDSPTTNNSVGFYSIEFLPIGRYQVMVQTIGFNTETIPAFNLEVLQAANFNVKLTVGSFTETVSVSAAAPILNTNDPTLDSTFTSNTIENFLLNGLDFSALTLYVPGSVNTNGVAGMTNFERSTYYSDTPNINGNRAQSNHYTLDGIDMNETYNNLISYSPAPAALEEVQVITANAPTGFGNVNDAGFTFQSFQNANLTGVGNPASGTAYSLIDNTYSYIDNLTWQRGLHYLSMSIEAIRYENNYPTGNNDGFLGALNYSGSFTSNGNGYRGAFQNYYDSKADYGPAGYDVRHNISGTGVYALPFGRGKEYLSNVSRIMDEVVGGWKISVAGVAYSGFPETITGGSNNSNSYGSGRVNQYWKLKVVNRSLNNWFGTDPTAVPCFTAGVDHGACAFGVPANNAFGTSKNGAMRGPGYLNVDMSAFKDFHTFRDQSVGFRFDAFNAFNIVSYGNPDTGITDSNYGNVSFQGPRSTERHLQFSAKYSF